MTVLCIVVALIILCALNFQDGVEGMGPPCHGPGGGPGGNQSRSQNDNQNPKQRGHPGGPQGCNQGGGKDSSSQLALNIAVPVVVCVTVIALVAIGTVILALYWKFKIKVMRETRRGTINNTYDISTSPAYQKSSHEDPLYSVLDPCMDFMKPPQLPPSRVPYYQEIESDMTAEKELPYEIPQDMTAEKELPYEIPLTSVPLSGLKQDGKVVEPYQEPADALRMEAQDVKRNE